MTRTAWFVTCAGAALLLLSFYLHPIGLTAGVLLVALLSGAAAKPYESLQIVAALLPLSTILSVVIGVEAGGWRLIEAMTLAFLTGVSGRHVVTGEPLQVHAALRWASIPLIGAILASGLISVTVSMTELAGAPTRGAMVQWYRAYAVHMGPSSFAGHFAEGILLFLLTADICARRPQRIYGVVKMMALGAASAALFNVLRLLIDGALVREDSWRAFLDLLLHVRANVHHGDLNAAGSYFALGFFLAVAVALRRPALGGASALLVAAGLWIAGSRVALVAAIIVAAVWAAGWLRQRISRGLPIAALLLPVMVSVALVSLSSLGRHVAEPSLALKIRLGLAEGALRMASDHPLYGVGIGNFYDQSRRYVDVPNYIVRENAHNNILQVLAELGIPGLFLFVTLLTLALTSAWRRLDRTMLCIVAGLCAYLLTALGGHPLLVPHSALPFWMALGLGASSSALLPRLASIRAVGITLMISYVVTVPWRTIHAVALADLEHTSSGFSIWQHDQRGRPYRYAGDHSNFYVSSSARMVSFDVRRGTAAPEIVEISLYLDERLAHRLTLRGHEWTTIRLPLLNRQNRFTRIDLQARAPGSSEPLDSGALDDGGVLEVGRPRVVH